MKSRLICVLLLLSVLGLLGCNKDQSLSSSENSQTLALDSSQTDTSSSQASMSSNYSSKGESSMSSKTISQNKASSTEKAGSSKISSAVSSSVISETVNYPIKLGDLPFRDICVLPDPVSKKYYMIGFLKSMPSAQEVACYESKDLINWGNYKTALYNNSEYKQSWAPELHYYNGSYYLFASLQTYEDGDLRGCYILKSDKPDGPYKKYSDRITPKTWQCLDGTLYVDDSGIPYMVYCREWINLPGGNGEMYAVRLTKNLKSTDGDPKLLFKAKDNKLSSDGVTDGPWLYKAKNNDLVMIWSKYINGKYTVISARSKDGIMGNWSQDNTPLFTNDGGHAMIFKDFSGNLKIAFHIRSSDKGNETPVIYGLTDNNGILTIKTN